MAVLLGIHSLFEGRAMLCNPDSTAGGSGVRGEAGCDLAGRTAAAAGCGNGVDAELTLVEQWETMPAGPALAALVFATDPQLLDPNTQVSYVAACQRLINMVTARQDAGVVAFVGANPRDTVYYVDGSAHALTDARALELQLALAWSEGHTRTRMHTARTLTTRLPACAAVVTSGSVQPLVTRALAEGAETLTASIDEAIAIGACQDFCVCRFERFS